MRLVIICGLLVVPVLAGGYQNQGSGGMMGNGGSMWGNGGSMWGNDWRPNPGSGSDCKIS